MAAANNEFFEALSMLEHERGITAEYLIDKIKAAIVIAVKKNYEVEDNNVMVEIDPANGKFNVALIQDVVADEDWYDEHSEIGITEAQNIRKDYKVGDRVVTPLKTKDFGRIAAQTAKHVIRQGIREAERSQQLSEIQSRAHDIVQATVTRVDPEKGIVAVDLGKGGEAILPRNEQVPGEVYTEGQMLQVYIVDVVASERGPRVMISRTHPGLVKRLFELEVPEIFDGTVEVKFTVDTTHLDGHDLVAFETLTTKETETDRETGEKTTVDKTVAEHKDIDDANQTVTVTSDKSSMAQTGRNILIGAAIAAAVAAGAGGTYIYRKRHQIDDADDMME